METNTIVSFEDSIDNIAESYLKNGQYYISQEKYPFDDIDDKKEYVVHFHINDNEIIIEEKNVDVLYIGMYL